MLAAPARGSIPANWRAPRTWLPGALCIHAHEAAWTNPGVDWQGNPVPFYGGYHFALGTWRSVGGDSWPHLATPREQTYRAYLVWKRDGRSWREWPNSRAVCGLA